jgi:hypothetical protein
LSAPDIHAQYIPPFPPETCSGKPFEASVAARMLRGLIANAYGH